MKFKKAKIIISTTTIALIGSMALAQNDRDLRTLGQTKSWGTERVWGVTQVADKETREELRRADLAASEVTLKGPVRSDSEKQSILNHAYSVAGVNKVINKIEVARRK